MNDPVRTRTIEEGSPFAVRLRRARLAAGLTQEELAERAGLSPNAVSELERGAHRHPYPATVRALAAGLGMTGEQRDALMASVPRRGERSVASGTRSAVPNPRTALIGREREVAAVAALLHRDDVPLVTLTGSGGVGKTRLALQVAADLEPLFAAGAVFVSLAAIVDAALVLPTVATALAVREGDRPLATRLRDALRDRELLLVLDNFEQVLAAAPAVANLLAACPRLTVLVTSRALLRLTGEHAFTVPPLALPDPDHQGPLAAVADVAAVRLFAQRARAAAPDFALTEANSAVVAAVCSRLDGLPLAIELAAARAAVLPPAALLARLEPRLPLLTGGPRDQPDRLRTMRGAIAWSHDLLNLDEQVAFRRLAVFVGGFTLEAAERVLGSGFRVLGTTPDPSPRAQNPESPVLDQVASLVDKSLLRRAPGPVDEPRYLMLETVREFAGEQLRASGDVTAVADAHAAYVLALAERIEPALFGTPQADAIVRVESDLGNVRAALAWSLERSDAAAALRIAGELWDFWHMAGHLAEGRRWLEAGLALGGPVPTPVRAKALQATGHLALHQGDLEPAEAALVQSLALNRELGDNSWTGNALLLLGIVAVERGDLDAAEARFAESRADVEALHEEAQAAGDESLLEVADYLMAAVDLQSGMAAFDRGDLAAADERFLTALSIARSRGHTEVIAAILKRRGLVDCARGDLGRAAAALREALGFDAASGVRAWLAGSFANLAVVAVASQRPDSAARLLGAADALREEVGLVSLALAKLRAYEDARPAARIALGEAGFAAAWAAGHALPLDEAIALAAAIAADPPAAAAGRRPPCPRTGALTS